MQVHDCQSSLKNGNHVKRHNLQTKLVFSCVLYDPFTLTVFWTSLCAADRTEALQHEIRDRESEEMLTNNDHMRKQVSNSELNIAGAFGPHIKHHLFGHVNLNMTSFFI